MKPYNFILLPMALLALTALPAAADDKPNNIPMDGKPVTESHQGKGKINSVDAKAGKINLSHGPIASLDWPGMTMDFEVTDKALLANVKPGQKIDFELVEVRKGKYSISKITAAK